MTPGFDVDKYAIKVLHTFEADDFHLIASLEWTAFLVF